MSRRKLTAKSRRRARRKLTPGWAQPYSAIELNPKIESLTSKIPKKYRDRIEATLSGPELLAIARAASKKRPKGRPNAPDKFQKLDRAAKAKAETGHYTQVAAGLRTTPKSLSDLVRNNRSYFDRKVEDLRKREVTSQ